jgi:hypothetical protein
VKVEKETEIASFDATMQKPRIVVLGYQERVMRRCGIETNLTALPLPRGTPTDFGARASAAHLSPIKKKNLQVLATILPIAADRQTNE